MLGAAEPPLRRGFRLERKRSNGAPAPAGPKGRGPGAGRERAASTGAGGTCNQEVRQGSCEWRKPFVGWREASSSLVARSKKITTPKGVVIFLDAVGIPMLGAAEPPLRRGFRLERKRSNGAPAPAGPKGRGPGAGRERAASTGAGGTCNQEVRQGSCEWRKPFVGWREASSSLVARSKKITTPKGVVIFFGCRGNSNARGGGAAPPPRFPPGAKRSNAAKAARPRRAGGLEDPATVPKF